MPRLKKRRRPQPEILARAIRIASTDASVFVHADKPWGLPARLESHPWLELRGWSDEPLRDVYEFSVHLHVDERTEPGPAVPPAVGAILQVRPIVDAVVGMAGVDFDRVWMLATSGHLHYCHLAFTQPRRRSALIVSASFSKEAEE